MKKEPTPTPDPIAVLNEEIADYNKQQWQATQDIQAAQQSLNMANQRFLLADGALQACKAVLAKLEVSDEVPSPAPAP